MASEVDGADVGAAETWGCEVLAADARATTPASASVTVADTCTAAIDLGSGTSSIALGTTTAWSANRTATFWAYQYGTNTPGGSYFNDEITGSVCPSWAIAGGASTGTYANQLLSVWHANTTCGSATWHTPGISNALLRTDWTHVAVVVTGGTSEWFINGVSVATYTTASVTPYARNRVMSMGSTGGYGGFLKAMIDDLAWWNRALSDAEIATVFESGPASVSATSLIGYWPMDEGSGTTFHDASGNGATGTIGENTWTTRCP
jgi:hypothetical protein